MALVPWALVPCSLDEPDAVMPLDTLLAGMKPIGWRVKDYADGWIECATAEDVLREVAAMGTALVEAVWEVTGISDVVREALQGPQPDRADEG